MKQRGLAQPHAVALVVLLVAGGLAGCMDDRADCVDGVCRDPAQPGQPHLTNATRPIATWEGCQGAFLNTQLPRDMVDPHVPDGFVGLGRAAFVRDVRIEVLDCPRAVIADLVVAPFQYAIMALFVTPENDSWEPEAAVSDYVYEAFVNNETAAGILRGWGLPAMHARFDIQRTDAAIGSRDDYYVAADDRSYEFTIHPIDQPGATTTFPLALWSGDETYRRVDVNFTRANTLNSQGATTVSMEGAAKLAEIHGQHTVPMAATPYRGASDEWRPHPTPFSPSRGA